LRTPRRLALLAVMFSALLAGPASAASPSASVAPWPQYQGNEGRTGVAPVGAPEPPYALAWDAPADIGDPSQVAGIPAPILSDGVAIVVGRSSVDAIDVGTGEQAWTVPRAIGPSSPAALEGHLLLFLEGGGDESTTSASTSTVSTTPTGATPSPSSSSSAEPSATPDASVSSLVAVGLGTQKRDWTVPLSDVSHTGVTVLGGVAVVGADDGTVTAIDATGKELWSQRVGDHVLAPIAASGDQVYAAVRPEARGAAALVALRASDGSQAWRYEPGSSVLDVGAPSVGQPSTGDTAGAGDTVFVVGSDASLRAVAASDGSERWAAPVYSPTAGSPPAVSDDAVYVTDQSGTVYAFDRATGQERWRFATNHAAVTAPIVTASAVLQPATDGAISAIAIASGHEIWHTTLVGSPVLGAGASGELFVLAHTGTAPGLAALRADPAGVTEDLASPTDADPTGLLVTWLAVAAPLSVALLFLGRRLGSRMGPAPLGPTDEEPLDPWEAELQDDA
jgi:outer membrane protein assembly factor BamB